MEPDFPFRTNPQLQALLHRLDLIKDCWDLLAGRKEHYLPRGEREPETAYLRRLEVALPSGFFRDALRTFAGMLASSHWRELPASLQTVLSDVDGRGTDLGVFLERADVLVLRDGATLIGVLPPEHLWPSEGDRQQALRNGDRLSLPRLVLLERRDVLDWHQSSPQSLPNAVRYRLPNPKRQQSTAQELERPEHPWLYGSVGLDGDGMALETSELVADPQAPSGWQLRRMSLQHYRGISQLPLIWYASDGAAFGEGDLPHLGLAHQYLNHFRCQSDYQELLYRTALPVGVRTGVIGPMGGGTSEPVVLGPNSVIDLPEGGSFQFVEIQARSLAEHRAWLESLDQGMRRDALIPSGAQGAPRTAMEISLAASQAYALLQSQAIQKASMFSSLLQHWCAITGEPLPETAGLQVSVSPLTPPVQPLPQVSEWIELFDKGVIGREELRQQLAAVMATVSSSTAQ
ncbi:MAG: DUF4055 domain-containing protein [Cyanobacteria bacterium K_DeepCast_35m_m2_023]|nr:DUF4055 domain-containing protein [Cyanobacteria bacterium K_DeepCast_35m_m2_023]